MSIAFYMSVMCLMSITFFISFHRFFYSYVLRSILFSNYFNSFAFPFFSFFSFSRYPWAGSACSELSVSYWFYIIQVLILVFSNAAMIPGVLHAVRTHEYVLCALLTSASVASSLYHLCDTDVFCVGGLSFKSLQVTSC